MKMFEFMKNFKTTLFVDTKTEIIEIEKGSLWFFVSKDDRKNRVVLCNNKIELDIASDILETHFERFG